MSPISTDMRSSLKMSESSHRENSNKPTRRDLWKNLKEALEPASNNQIESVIQNSNWEEVKSEIDTLAWDSEFQGEILYQNWWIEIEPP